MNRLIAFAGTVASSVVALPTLNFDGFAWAENLAFDGNGNLFVTEAKRGEIWRIYLCSDGTEYCGYIHQKGFKALGGLQISADGSTIYAGATLEDDSYAIISTPTSHEKNNGYEIVTQTDYQANGMAGDWVNNNLYYTFEGTARVTGSLNVVNLDSTVASVVDDDIDGADGLWFDDVANKLYVGELTAKNIVVFDTASGAAAKVGDYAGLSSLSRSDMLDDLTIYSTAANGNVSSTILLGADFSEKQIKIFQIDGTMISTLTTPSDVPLYQHTSVRWGKGPGFDPNSVYVSEGGGMTGRETDRRVYQIQVV